MDTAQQKLERLPRGSDGEPRYRHPAGYLIAKERRTWNERVGRIHGQADPPPPLTWWSVYRYFSNVRLEIQPIGRSRGEFNTLRSARAWCDENPRRRPSHVS